MEMAASNAKQLASKSVYNATQFPNKSVMEERVFASSSLAKVKQQYNTNIQSNLVSTDEQIGYLKTQLKEATVAHDLVVFKLKVGKLRQICHIVRSHFCGHFM